MTPAVVGWIVLGVLCAAALILMLLGIVHVIRAQRRLKNAQRRLEETRRRALNLAPLEAGASRIARDAALGKDLIERARRALSTIGVAIRYCAVAVRIAKSLT